MTATTLEALTAASPDWLAQLRREAWERYESIPFPSGREEVWRYTDLKLLRPDQFEPQAMSSGATTLADKDRDAGVIACSLTQAVEQYDELLRPRLGALVGPEDPFTALSLSLHRGGHLVYVPAGVSVGEPIELKNTTESDGAALFPRTVLIVEDGAHVVFNDVFASRTTGRPSLFAPVTEVFVGKGARVGWVTWQDHSPGIRHLAHVKAHLDRDARLDTLVVTLGGDYSRTWEECVLAGEGAESNMLGLYFPHGEQRFEHWTLQDHAAPHTRSDLLYKGAVADTAQSVYYGTIKVRHGAAKTDAYQANRNLTLSPKAIAHTNPQLEIHNNDVRCTHGATVGRVNEEHMFYLMSRGIPRPEAERLIVFGFFNEVLGRVVWSGMQDRLADAIGARVER
jgi:Fe-S cluster assembly protein SufD